MATHFGYKFVVICQVGPTMPTTILSVALVRKVLLELGLSHILLFKEFLLNEVDIISLYYI